mgnify:FL=1
MSETIDKRIVQMRFDNAQFESGVSKTMGTLDKLKKALHLENAIDGISKVQSAFSKFDTAGVTGGIDTINAKFSAMQTVAFTVMQNIVNDAYAKGKQLAEAFTIEPVFSGFQEYETQINAVQTILANTQDKGSTLEDVNKALDELNHYADLTIYNFTEMTRNIGTFTAAGVDLQSSAYAIKGIANLAAVSGSTSYQASTAMYQLSQAIAAGTVNLQDWNSVVNAGMGGQVFQNALKRTARQMGQDVDGMIEKFGSFRLSLSEGKWLTADVLTETLKQFAGAYSEADLIQKGYSQSQAAEIVKMAETATNAATKVKTFTQLFDTLKEAAQSGWTQTWEIIVGDFEEAKDFLTGLSDYFSDIINKSAEKRNNFLEEVFSSSGQYVHKEDWENLTNNGVVGYAFRTALMDTARAHGIAIDQMIAEEGSFSESLKNGWLTLDIFNEVLDKTKENGLAAEAALSNTGTTVENLKNVVAEVIRGNWGAGDDWKQALTDAGYNMEVIRDLVNQTYDGVDYDLGRISEETWNASAAMAGYGDAVREVGTAAYFAGNPVMDLVDKLQRPTGRELMIESVWNIIKGIGSIIKPIKEAWDETFAGPSAEGVYQMIAGFEKLTEKLNISFSTSLKIKSAFKGVFAVFDIGVMAVKAVVNAIVPLTSGLNGLGSKALNAASTVGKFLTNIRDGIRDTNAFSKLIENGGKLILYFLQTLISSLKDLTGISIDFDGIFSKISDFFEKLGTAMVDPNVFYKMGDAIKQFFSEVKGVITGELSIEDTGFYFVAGFVEGLKSYVKMAYDKVREFGQKLLETIKEVLGIHSPSQETFDIAVNFVLGFINGLVSMIEGAYKAVRDFALGVIRTFKEGLAGSSSSDSESEGENFVYKFAQGLKTGFEVIKSIVSGIINWLNIRVPQLFDWLNKQTHGFDISVILGYLKDFASIKFLMSGSSFLKDMSNGGLFNKLFDVLDTLKDKISSFGEVATKQTNGLLAFAEAIALLTLSLYGLANIPDFQSQLVKLGELIAVAVSAYGAILALNKGLTVTDDSPTGGLMNTIKAFFGLNKNAKQMKVIGTMMLKFAASIFILAGAIKMMASIPEEDATRSMYYIAALMAEMVVATRAINKANGSLKGAGSAMLGMAASVLILTFALKQLSAMSNEDFINGAIKMFALLGELCIVIRLATGKIGKNTSLKGLGFAFIGLAASLLIIVRVVQQLADMEWSDLIKGMGSLLMLMTAMLFAGEAIGNTSGGMKSAGLQMVLMATSMLIFAEVIRQLGSMSIESLIKGFAGFCASMIILCKSMKSLAKNNAKGALASTASIILLGIGLKAVASAFEDLGRLSWETISKGIISMVSTVGSMALLIKVSKGVKAGDIVKILLEIAGVVAAITAVSYVLGATDQASGGNLSSYIAKTSEMLEEMIKSFGLMVTMGVTIAGIAAAMDKFNLNASFGAVLKVMLVIGEVIGLLTVVMTAIGGLVQLIEYYTPLDVVSAINKFGDIMFAVGEALGKIVGGALSGILSFIPDVGTYLSEFGKNITPFFASLDVLSSDSLDLADILVGVILQLAAAEFLNGINKLLGFGSGNALDTLEDDLGSIGDAVKTFAEKTAGINTEDATRAANVAQVIANLYENLPKTGGVIQDIFGEQDLSRFGEGMQNVAEGIVKFAIGIGSMKLVNVSDDDVDKAMNIAKVLCELQNNLPETGGKIQSFFGEKSLENFGTGMGHVGTGIKNFITNLGNVTVNSDLVKAALYVAQTLAELQNNLPASGGAIQDFFGSQDLEQFGNQMGAVGSGINAFVTSLGNVAISDDQVDMAENVGTMLSKLEDNLTKHGGAITFFTGDSDFGEFSENIGKLGTGLLSFSIKAKLLDTNASNKAVEIAEDLSSIENNLDNTAWWEADNNLGVFGGNIRTFGESLQILNGISSINLDGVISSIKSLMMMFSNDNYVVEADDFDSWCYGLKQLGENLASFVSDGMTSDNATSALHNGAVIMVESIRSKIIDNAYQFATAAVTVFGSDEGFLGGINKVDPMITAKVKTILNLLAFTMKSYNQQYKSIGEGLFRDNFLVGIQTQSGVIIATSRNIAQSMWQTIANYTNSFFGIGVQLMYGLASGIYANRSAAINASAAVAAQALRRSRDVLGIHSPSKEFFEIGRYSVLGMSNGFTENSNLITNAAGEISDEAMNVIVDIVQRIQDMLDGNLEYTPTIRPIMDATNIQNGVSAINSMFGNRYLGSLGNIDYVNQMRADRGNIINPIVEVDNTNVVDAINNVGSRIDKLEAAMYNMQIQMDSNATVGQIYNKMDKRLGRQAKYKERGI